MTYHIRIDDRVRVMGSSEAFAVSATAHIGPNNGVRLHGIALSLESARTMANDFYKRLRSTSPE